MLFRNVRQSRNQLNQVMPWMSGISSPKQYQELITTMEVLIENYDAHQPEIDLMFPGIERYEEEAEQFSELNQSIEKLEPGIAMLRVIIDQHQLTLSDFQEEIGAKSTVSMILVGKRSLTLSHIKALSARLVCQLHCLSVSVNFGTLTLRKQENAALLI